MFPNRQRTRLRQRPREQLQRDPALEPDIVEDDFGNVQNREIATKVLLEGKKPCIPGPVHPGWLTGDMEWVVLIQWRAETLAVYDLHVEDLGDVDCGVAGSGAETGEGVMQVCVCVGCFARRGGRVCINPSRDVVCIQTDTEVGSVDTLHHVPALFPGVDVVAPCQGLVDEADGRGFLLETHVCNALQIRYDQVFITCRPCSTCSRVCREEIGRDLDHIRAQDPGEMEPSWEFLGDETFVLVPV